MTRVSDSGPAPTPRRRPAAVSPHAPARQASGDRASFSSRARFDQERFLRELQGPGGAGRSFSRTLEGPPAVPLQATMARLAAAAAEAHRPTPGGLGAQGCAAAMWAHVIRPALVAAYPGQAIPAMLQTNMDILRYVQANQLGRIQVREATDLRAADTPPGSVMIGLKPGHDQHMLVAVDVDWREIRDPRTQQVVKILPGQDGRTDAYAGNTGLPEWGPPHFRIQEFAEDLGFLNMHHGALNSGHPANPYRRFVIMDFDAAP